MRQTDLAVLLALFIIMATATFERTADAVEQQTGKSSSDELVISVDAASYIGRCIRTTEFSRGDTIVFRINITYASTNARMEEGRVNIHLSNGETLQASFVQKGWITNHPLWKYCYNISWDATGGVLRYYVTAQDNKGNFAVWKPSSVDQSELGIRPVKLLVQASLSDYATGNPITSSAQTGQGIAIRARAQYPDINDLNGTKTLPSILTSREGGAVTASLYPSSDASKPSLSPVTTAKLDYSPDEGDWRGTLNLPDKMQSGNYTISIEASDGAGSPNKGLIAIKDIRIDSAPNGPIIGLEGVYLAVLGLIVAGAVIKVGGKK
ncbi:MAG: hypothetical protein HYU39_02925 [Thaumarchaeota archaeon]|nr:hypothetical protein [Nitrososphaerota archaeon]